MVVVVVLTAVECCGDEGGVVVVFQVSIEVEWLWWWQRGVVDPTAYTTRNTPNIILLFNVNLEKFYRIGPCQSLV